MSRSVAFLILSATVLTACVGTELAVPTTHPGNPQARAATLPSFSGLRADFDASRDAASSNAAHDHAAAPAGSSSGTDPHAGHAHWHEGHDADGASAPEQHGQAASAPKAQDGSNAAAVSYTCPMHPEVEQDKPGACPKCGMKLVPKKESK
jgi:hypothetical protein